jgi:hypothetical protein
MGWRKWIVRPASNDSGEGAGVNTRGRVFSPIALGTIVFHSNVGHLWNRLEGRVDDGGGVAMAAHLAQAAVDGIGVAFIWAQ